MLPVWARSRSRRQIVVTGVSLVLCFIALRSSLTQELTWHHFREEELGFELEFPGVPKIERTKAHDADDDKVREVDAQVRVAGILFGANFQEFKSGFSIKDEAIAQREGARHMQGKVVREEKIDFDGVSGLEVVMDLQGSVSISRIVECGACSASP
jgi:hypothetical protein